MSCPSTTHAVVVVSGSGSTFSGYTINDPLDGAVKNFSYYSNCQITALHLYSGTPWCSGGGGGACAGPSVSSPADGYVSSSQTITFNWSALSGCTFSGYTFRIKDTSNMDSGGNTIVDTGEGSTSHTSTIGTQWNNMDLYWGVRAANAPNGANWSVRHFRIQPGSSCSNPSGQVILYNQTNCGGSTYSTNGTGNYDMSSSFNDRQINCHPQRMVCTAVQRQ